MTQSAFTHIGVLGAGAWGTALAQTAALGGRDVTLWGRNADHIIAMANTRMNDARLPGVTLDPRVACTSALADLAACDVILSVVPTQATRDVLNALSPHKRSGAPVISASKGLERGAAKTVSTIIRETLPDAPVGVLTGPSFAHEVAQGLPAAVTLAAETLDLAERLAGAVGRPEFRIYLSDDVLGAEIGGAVKNVLAIACGVVDGRGLGRSAHAGLITRGFAEMTRLGLALGARADTLRGLSGLGDLVLTCSSPQSRNMAFGRAVGTGRPVGDVLNSRTAVTEGVATAPVVLGLAQALNVELPICAAVNAIIAEDTSVEAAIDGLLSRPIREEAL